MPHRRFGWIALAVSGLAHAALLAWNPDLGEPPRTVRPAAPPALIDLSSPKTFRPILEPSPDRPPVPTDRAVSSASRPPRLSRLSSRIEMDDLLDEVGWDLPEIGPVAEATLPVLVHAPDPPYPLQARRRRMEGTVVLAVLVDEEGRVADCRIARSSGFDLFDAAALETARSRWRFRPATDGRGEVAKWVRVPVRFRLRGPAR